MHYSGELTAFPSSPGSPYKSTERGIFIWHICPEMTNIVWGTPYIMLCVSRAEYNVPLWHSFTVSLIAFTANDNLDSRHRHYHLYDINKWPGHISIHTIHTGWGQYCHDYCGGLQALETQLNSSYYSWLEFFTPGPGGHSTAEISPGPV